MCVHQCCYISVATSVLLRVCTTLLLGVCTTLLLGVCATLLQVQLWMSLTLPQEMMGRSPGDGEVEEARLTAAKTISTISASSVCALCVCVEGEKQDPDKQILCSKCDMASTSGYWTRPSHMFLMMRTGVCVCMCGCIWVYVDLVTF